MGPLVSVVVAGIVIQNIEESGVLPTSCMSFYAGKPKVRSIAYTND